MTNDNYDFQKQFSLSQKDYRTKLDFLNWYRFFFIIKEALLINPKSILEIGPGEGTIKNILQPHINTYETFDVNSNLNPTHLGDIRTTDNKLKGRYDCVIAADILEHIPFEDLGKALQNIRVYLKEDGVALITIPHRAWFIFWMTWLLGYRHFLWRFPDWVRTLYQRFRGRRVNPIDPDHLWEIGDGKHKVKSVEEVMKNAGFKIEKRQKLIYVDFWILIK